LIYCLQSAAKLNITLRVTGRREDGYHELRSLFYRLPSVETLTIEANYDHNVKNKIIVTGEPVRGRNILEDVLALAGEKGSIPRVRVCLHKVIPPGSGLGGGSGNAAALISWLNALLGEGNSVPCEEIGSDVPFFLEGGKWALVGGRGENVEPFSGDMPLFSVAVVIPSWSMSTSKAFSLLAEEFHSGFPMTIEEAEHERSQVLEKLKSRRYCGLLPNDFNLVLMRDHPEYRDLFRLFQDIGAVAWGITGSGGAAFGFFNCEGDRSRLLVKTDRIRWIRKILFLE